MSGGWKDVVKSGWHPEKTGTTLKDQVKGLVGRSDSPSSREQHIAPPISSLRDPSSFGPPPKHVAAYGRTSTAQTQPTAGAAASSYTPAQSSSHAEPLGSQTYSSTQPYQAQHAVEEEPPTKRGPYRADTTGLSTSHLPPPPTRSSGVGGQTPQPSAAYSPAPVTTQAAATAKPKAPPSLPPRLPPRSGNNSPSPTIASELPTGQAGQARLNQGAINRLGAAGISVPGLGIGGGGGTPPPPPEARPSPPLQGPGYGQVDELQARFARMGAPSPSQAGGNGTSVTSRTQQQPIAQAPAVLGKKKPPPPPMSKKPELSGTRAESINTPPPIPLATRPRFG